MRHQPGEARREDSAALLARLAQDAYAWGRTLESARQDLAGAEPGLPAGRLLPDDSGASWPDAGTDVIARALAQAEHDVMLVEPGGALLLWTDGLQPLIAAAAARGCRVRLLIGRPVPAAARPVAAWLAAIGAEVRAGHTPEWAMLTADLVALLRAGADDPLAVTVLGPADGALFLRDLAGLLWAAGSGLAEQVGQRTASAAQPATPDGQVDSRIVELLAEGAKDETIARVLGISLRTCRRRIAEIMTGLNAVSRFQAGVNAARLGVASAEPVRPQR